MTKKLEAKANKSKYNIKYVLCFDVWPLAVFCPLERNVVLPFLCSQYNKLLWDGGLENANKKELEQ